LKKLLLAALLLLTMVPAFVTSAPEQLAPPREPDDAPRPTAPAPSTRRPRDRAAAAAEPAAPAPSTVCSIAENESDALVTMMDIHVNRANFGSQPLRKSGYVFAVFRGDTEEEWIAYAWPEEYGRTGRRTFMLSRKARILETDSSAYSGDAGPLPEAADRPTPGMAGTLGDVLSYGGTGTDGNAWKWLGDVRIQD